MSERDAIQDRILRMEATVAEYTLRVAQQSTQLEYLQAAVDTLPAQFEKFSESIGDKIDNMMEKTSAHAMRFSKLDSRLEKLESEEEEKARRRALFRKIFLAVATAIGGALGSKAVEYFATKGS